MKNSQNEIKRNVEHDVPMSSTAVGRPSSVALRSPQLSSMQVLQEMALVAANRHIKIATDFILYCGTKAKEKGLLNNDNVF